MTKWFSEKLYPSYAQSFGIKRVLFERNTGHQHLIIFENEDMGNVMALDGIIQTTERDEFMYHEMLAHVPLFAHHNPKKVLIIGGGDGGIAREVVRHKQIERIVQVEIDQAVIDMAREYFPRHSNGAFDDPRLEIVIEDGFRFVHETDEKFDVIISDSTDPVGPGEVLFTNDFYRGVRRCLNDKGIFAAQNGVAFMQPEEVTNTWRRFEGIFADRWFYVVPVPTYVGGFMTLAWGSLDTTARQLPIETIEQRFHDSGIETRYYTPEVHKAAFALPRYILDLLH
ncbi:MAG: polyamine aminopropyltransferase [Gammaproteobacteria bacterium]|nr:MAG: polyamine aminopropyltransferase [Gammaproteobacteria bacterium]